MKNNGNIIAGLDAGHITTKALIMSGREILGYGIELTGFDVAAAAETALNRAVGASKISRRELAGIVSTGIFRELLKESPLNVTMTVPEYAADAKGAFFLNRNSRTVIDIGGNIHKAMHYDQNGTLLDVIQNDKCADGLGIFYTNIARTLGLSEQELSELALKSTREVSIVIQCALSAESEAIDLMCQGVDAADVADAVSKFMSERVAAMCTYMPLTKEIVAAGGLAKCAALIKHVSRLLKQDVAVVDLPEYVGAIGAAMSYEDGK